MGCYTLCNAVDMGGRTTVIDWLPILVGEPSKLFEPSDYDKAMAELDEYLKNNLDNPEPPR
jgi:hypothetical protein